MSESTGAQWSSSICSAKTLGLMRIRYYLADEIIRSPPGIWGR